MQGIRDISARGAVGMGFLITPNPPTLSRYGLLLIGIILVCVIP